MGEGGGTGVGESREIIEVVLRQTDDTGRKNRSFFDKIYNREKRLLGEKYGMYKYVSVKGPLGTEANGLVLHHKSGTTIYLKKDSMLSEDQVTIIGQPSAIKETRQTLEELAKLYHIEFEEVLEKGWGQYFS